MSKTLVSLGVAAAILCSTSAGMAAEKASQKFVKEAIEGNLAEISMGQMAQEKGQSDAVKSFGQQLQKDHSDANQRAMALASQMGMTPPSEPNKKQKADAAKLAKLSGDKFDKAFAKHMVADHKQDIKDFKKASKMKGDEATVGFANETLPVLEKHLEMAQSLTKSK
jgi:putative membrane protein